MTELEFRPFRNGKMISVEDPECYCQRYEIRESPFTLEILPLLVMIFKLFSFEN